jgi:hypothetical protein
MNTTGEIAQNTRGALGSMSPFLTADSGTASMTKVG